MRRWTIAAVIPLLLAAGAPASAAPDANQAPAAGPARAAPPDSSLTFVVETGNRLYPDWHEENRVRLRESFYIGDTAYSATLVGFMPDFRIKAGKPINFSSSMNNPAVRVFVYDDSAAVVDSSWAFLDFPPHFSPRSFFSFRLKEIIGSGWATTEDGKHHDQAHE